MVEKGLRKLSEMRNKDGMGGRQVGWGGEQNGAKCSR